MVAEQSSFTKALESVINQFSKENGSDTPDFILAEFLTQVLEAWNVAVKRREAWYGRAPKSCNPPVL